MAAVALLIDYVVTVAVQTAAGSAAIVSAFPALSRLPALPTYLFAGSLLVMIAAGLVRELTVGLPRILPAAGSVGIGSHSGLIAFGAVYVMAKAFANGGSALTGIEAVSNAVSALRPPEGRHARQILATQGTIVATALFLGRAGIEGIEPGARIRLRGKVGTGADGRPVMTNRAYELLP